MPAFLSTVRGPFGWVVSPGTGAAAPLGGGHSRASGGAPASGACARAWPDSGPRPEPSCPFNTRTSRMMSPVTSTAAAPAPNQNRLDRGRRGAVAGGGNGRVAGGPDDGQPSRPPVSTVVTGPAANGSFGELIVLEATTRMPARATAEFSPQWTIRRPRLQSRFPGRSAHARDTGDQGNQGRRVEQVGRTDGRILAHVMEPGRHRLDRHAGQLGTGQPVRGQLDGGGGGVGPGRALPGLPVDHVVLGRAA